MTDLVGGVTKLFKNHVTIGPEFFVKAFNDYASWHWAIVREFMQNSIDCGSDTIQVTVELNESENTVVLTVSNNGDPMSREILVEKLLALGGSGKNFQNTVGGFGKAKEILYFAHRSYKIETGDWTVAGSGAGYNLEPAVSHYHGTRSTVVIVGAHHFDRIVDVFRLFAGYTKWDGQLTLNGEHLATNLRSGTHRRDLGFGAVYTNKLAQNKMIIRINGVPMYHTYTGFNHCVVIELVGASVDTLTSNRDGLNDKCRHELNSFIAELIVDKRSALLKKDKVRYYHYDGLKFCHEEDVGAQTINQLVGSVRNKLLSCVPSAGNVRQVSVSNSKAVLDNEFIIKNETDFKIPAYYFPDRKEFCAYSRKLIRIWGRLLLELHRLFNTYGDFAIGFIFDENCEAEFEKGQYGSVYYLNPAKIVSSSFKKRFKLTERNRLLMIALHEFVHGIGFGSHDEYYSNKLTDMAWQVLDNRSRFNQCFL